MGLSPAASCNLYYLKLFVYKHGNKYNEHNVVKSDIQTNLGVCLELKPKHLLNYSSF